MSNFVPDYGKIQLERPRRDAAGEYELGLDVAPCQGCYGWRCGHAVCAHRFAHFRRDGAVLGSDAAATAAGSHPILGDLLVLFAQLSYATYLVLFKNFICRYSLVTVMKWMFTYAFLCTLPFSYSSLVATDWLALGWDDVLAVAFIVVFATFVSYMFIIVGQKNLRPTVAGMYNYVQPVVACVVTVCLGLDSFNVMKGLAVAMIFVGVFLVTTSKSRADERREARR